MVEQYGADDNNVSVAREVEQVCDAYKGIEDYEQEFSNLSVGVVKGKKLPHKAILLLAIIKLIEDGVITQNRIELDNITADAFASRWHYYFGEIKLPSVWTPFWYLKSESFWHFMPKQNDGVLEELIKFAGHPSIGQMRPVIKYAYLDKALFDCLTENESRIKLKYMLENEYVVKYY